MVRISGGSLRGRNLQVLSDGWIRPTMGRVREALFSMLMAQIPGATVLDLFAGCGLLGLEALSRGAHAAFFVDLEPKAVQIIKKNVTLCGMGDHGMVQHGSACNPATLEKVQQLATQHHGNHKAFDVVFVDPPYRKGLVASSLQALTMMANTEPHFLATDAIVVTEQEAETSVEPLPSWSMLQNRRYGETRLVLWRRQAIQGPACNL